MNAQYRPFVAGLCCLIATFLPDSYLKAEGVDFGPLGRSVYELGPLFLNIREVGLPSDFPQKIALKRKEVIDYTLENAGRRMTMIQWAFPFIAAYEWSLEYGIEDYATAEREVRAAISTIQTLDGTNAIRGAYIISAIVSRYADRWMESEAPACVRLLDETEVWIESLSHLYGQQVMIVDGEKTYPMPNTILPDTWWYWCRHVQAQILNHEDQFEPEDREWLWRSRQQKLGTIVSAEHLPLDHRTSVISHWAEVLMANGRGELAEPLLNAWWRKTEGGITCPRYLRTLLRAVILEKADWEHAGRIVEYANSLVDLYIDPSDRRFYQNLSEFYYAKMTLPDYELQRQRTIRKQTWRERLETADRNRAAKKQP